MTVSPVLQTTRVTEEGLDEPTASTARARDTMTMDDLVRAVGEDSGRSTAGAAREGRVATSDPILVAVRHQAYAAHQAAAAVRGSSGLGDSVYPSGLPARPVGPGEVADRGDPQQWLFAERARYQQEGTCDPYAMAMLLQAGLLPVT